MKAAVQLKLCIKIFSLGLLQTKLSSLKEFARVCLREGLEGVGKHEPIRLALSVGA
jgi:hypothetical protein